MKILIILISALLTSCSTIEIAHDPLRCLDRPLKSLSERIELSDLSSLSDKTFDGLEAHIIAYQQRIKSQCILINKHNKNHNKE